MLLNSHAVFVLARNSPENQVKVNKKILPLYISFEFLFIKNCIVWLHCRYEGCVVSSESSLWHVFATRVTRKYNKDLHLPAKRNNGGFVRQGDRKPVNQLQQHYILSSTPNVILSYNIRYTHSTPRTVNGRIGYWTRTTDVLTCRGSWPVTNLHN